MSSGTDNTRTVAGCLRATTDSPRRLSRLLLLAVAGAFVLIGRHGVIAQAPVADDSIRVPPNWLSGFGNPYPPARGASYVDPIFGSNLWRVTDALAAGYEFLNVEYSNGQHFNASETLLRLVGQLPGGGYQVLFVESTPPFNVVRVGSGLASSNPSDFYWHPTDPDLLYHVAFERLMAYSVSQDASTLVHAFMEYGSITGAGETQMSRDGSRIALVGTDPGTFELVEVFVYDLAARSKIATMPLPGSFDSVRMTPTGRGIVVQGTAGAHYYSIQGSRLVHEREVMSGAGHSDVGLGPNDVEYLFAVKSTEDNNVYAARIDAPGETLILPVGWRGLPTGMHVSANSTQNDGWVHVVTYADGVPNNDPALAWAPFAAEVIRARYDGGGYERLAHSRTGGFPDPRFGTYWGSTARGSVSSSGRYVVWNANFMRQITAPVPVASDYGDVYLLDTSAVASPPGPAPPPSAAPPSDRFDWLACPCEAAAVSRSFPAPAVGPPTGPRRPRFPPISEPGRCRCLAPAGPSPGSTHGSSTPDAR